MTIGCVGASSDKVSITSPNSDSSKNVNIKNQKNCHSMETNFVQLNSSKIRKKNKTKSDNSHLLSQFCNNRETRKKTSDLTSTSVPLATQIYKASSDDFKQRKKNNKKCKKSVLTLPNEPSIFPKVYTVSDINESEYKRIDGVRWKQKYRTAARLKKRPNLNHNCKVYDEVSQYYSKLKIDLDCGAPNMIKPFKGNAKKKHTTDMSGECQAHDVWTLLRNINRFQFRPSPTMSETSIEQLKKNSTKRRNNRKDTRLIETCRTEEIAFSFDLKDGSSNTLTQSTSFDRVTVIDKRNELKNFCETINIPVSPTHSRHKKLAINKVFSNAKSNNFVTNIVNNPGAKLPEKNRRLYEEKASSEYKEKSQNSHLIPTNNHKNTSILISSTTCPVAADSFNRKIILQHNVVDDDEFQDKSPKTSAHSSLHVIKGITKVVVKENEKSLQGDYELPKRKSRLVTTMPSSSSSTKLTQALTKKRLANLRFPITILTKDQINPIKIPNYEFPQFEGLDQQIWPFMKDWFDKDSGKKVKEREHKKPVDPTIQKCDTVLLKNKKKIDFNSFQKKENEHFTNCNKNETQIEQVKKHNGFHHFKDKMLKLLYKKSQINDTSDLTDTDIRSPQVLSNFIKKHYSIGHVDVGTNPQVIHNTGSKSFGKRLSVRPPPPIARIPSPEAKLPQVLAKPLEPKFTRSKPNWANDFIESVIRKIKNGIYYNQESPCLVNVKESFFTSVEKDKVDTESENVEPEISEELEKSASSILMVNIPGFDEPLPALEILTLTDNRIAIKQCLTNITMQFDIILPLEASTLQNTGVIVPSLLNTLDDAANISKCNTTILNAVLPAELCSIVPKMLHELSVNSAKVAISSVEINKTHSQLSTISELSRCDSVIAQPNIVLSVGMKLVFGGRYSHHMPLAGLNNYSTPNIYHLKDVSIIGKIMPEAKVLNLILFEEVYLPRPLHLKREKYPEPTCIAKRDNIISTDLKLKPIDSLQLKQSYGKFNLCDFISKIARSSNFMITVNIQNFSNLYTYEFSNTMDDTQNQIVVQFTMNLNYRTSQSNSCSIKTVQHSLENNVHTKKQVKSIISTKIRKRNYLKLYKKCKSTSNIPVKKTSTPLDEINNLDQFCQVLGSDKAVCSVFDGIIEKKIMACLLQMKSWISEITSVQAMLVLLLLNRKDSPNLIRLRPILLQAISVNRITRANELDMEVEVIENEQFKMPFEYAQIPYKPAAVRVADADDEKLLEELCWIAKTTASDYQRIYDDTSEKLLKTLINKRRKLNPSYLRVMARYVGLGLLKSPLKL